MEEWIMDGNLDFSDVVRLVKSLSKKLCMNLNMLMDYSRPLFDTGEEFTEMMSYMVEYCVWMVAKKQIKVIPKNPVILLNLTEIARYYLEQGNTELTKALCDLLDELSVSQSA